MIERLQRKTLSDGLHDASKQQARGGMTLSLDYLEHLLGATFEVLREMIVAKSFHSNQCKIDNGVESGSFLKLCADCGIPFAYADLLANSLSVDSVLDLHRRIKEVQEQVREEREHAGALEALVVSEVSKIFIDAKETLLEYLQVPKFREWLRRNQDYVSKCNGPVLFEASLAVEPWYPIPSVCAFFNEYACKDVAAGLLDLDHREILNMLILKSNSQNKRAQEAEAESGLKQKLKSMASHVSRESARSSIKCESAETCDAEVAAARKKRVLKKFRSAVYRAVTAYHNPSILSYISQHHKQHNHDDKGGSEQRAGFLGNARMLSVQESTPQTPMVARKSTEFVVIQHPEHEKQITASTWHISQANFTPTILFISCALTGLVIVRTFSLNMCSLMDWVEWLMSLARWLNETCNRIEMFGGTGIALLQCFTPDKMQLMMNSPAAAELQKSLQELFDLHNGANDQALVGAQSSLTAVKEITSKVDFVALQVATHSSGKR